MELKQLLSLDDCYHVKDGDPESKFVDYGRIVYE